MRVLDGGEVDDDELAELGFEAEGELETALNEAFVQLGEFAQARQARVADAALDQRMRAELQARLDNIVNLCIGR
jgi:hypothetical protein